MPGRGHRGWSNGRSKLGIEGKWTCWKIGQFELSNWPEGERSERRDPLQSLNRRQKLLSICILTSFRFTQWSLGNEFIRAPRFPSKCLFRQSARYFTTFSFFPFFFFYIYVHVRIVPCYRSLWFTRAFIFLNT